MYDIQMYDYVQRMLEPQKWIYNTERSAHCYNRLGTLKELSHFQPDISVSVNWVGTSLYSGLRLRTWILILGSCIVLMLLRLDSFLSWFIFVRWGRATKWFIGSLDQCTVSEPFTEVWSEPFIQNTKFAKIFDQILKISALNWPDKSLVLKE